MAERKFLQETNFQEEYDEDIIPERRGRDQLLNRPVYPGNGNANRPESLRKAQQEAYIKSFLEE